MIAVFDPKTGAAGDMVLGCLLDVLEDHEKILSHLMEFIDELGDVEVVFTEETQEDLSLANLEVKTNKEIELGFEEIKRTIKKSNLNKKVKESSCDVFELIYEAEKSVHGEETHFHEVGRADALVDVVGSSLAFHELSPDKVYCTTIRVGGGFVETSHGSLKVPAPATEEILRNSDLSWRGGPVDFELLTPTGAALLSYFVDESVEFFPEITSRDVGRAKGSREIGLPNYLSVTVGEEKNRFERDVVYSLQTNVDDVDGEVIGYLKNKLMKNGALDVSVLPLHMKKDRSGYLINVLCKKDLVGKLSKLIIKELGTLGVRIFPYIHRLLAKRKNTTVSFLGHEVNVKIGLLGDGEVIDVSAEYEDCEKVAVTEDIPLKEVKERIEKLAREELIE